MRNMLKNLVENKKVLIVGFGREGRSTFNLLMQTGSFSSLAVSDIKPVDLHDYPDVVLHSGQTYLDVLDEYDVVFKSPGVVLPKKVSEYKCKITSQTELFLKKYGNQVVGITGTKGKSTTSSLMYHVLDRSGVPCILAGNIGIPVFDIVNDLDETTVVVFEMSCHQLENLETSPKTAVFLNLYEDHLDHYGTFFLYSEAKKNIYRHQGKNDILFVNPDFLPAEGECAAEICQINRNTLPEHISEISPLRGKHNLFNVAAVYQVCKHLTVSDEDFESALPPFKTLAHRLEYIGSIGDVEYFDDSISTTVESTISAVNSIPNAGSVLIGGMDRGIEYSSLVDFLSACDLDQVIFMYESGKRIYERVIEKAESNKAKTDFVYLPDLKSSVEYAKRNTKPGKACILSPAAASYGEFKNFEERGNEFKRLVFEK